MTDWRLIDSGPCAASFNMALDEALAMSVRNGASNPVLRVYGWSAPSLSLGAFQKPDGINIHFCRDNHIPVVRRLTGGRAVLHADELTYSFSAKNESGFSGRLTDVYMKIGVAFLLCFRKLGLDCLIKEGMKKGAGVSRSPLCFESQSTGEISHAGLKLIGSAQRRWNDAFMQQGSIPFSVDSLTLSGIFGEDKARDRRHQVMSGGLRRFIPDIDAKTLKRYLVASFEEAFKVSLTESLPLPGELRLAEHLEFEKYPDLAVSQEERPDKRCGNKRETESTP